MDSHGQRINDLRNYKKCNLLTNRNFAKLFESLFLVSNLASFVTKLHTDNRFQFRAVINEMHAFKIVRYGLCMGVIRSKL